MADHITHDPIYNTLDRDDFDSMLEVERYCERSDAFDQIISATVDHFWDPGDPRYLDYHAGDFDMHQQMVMPREFNVELNCAVADRLNVRRSLPPQVRKDLGGQDGPQAQ